MSIYVLVTNISYSFSISVLQISALALFTIQSIWLQPGKTINKCTILKENKAKMYPLESKEYSKENRRLAYKGPLIIKVSEGG